MGDLFFVARVFIVTIFFVLFMQIKIGQTTLDEKAYRFLQSSSVTASFRDFAQKGFDQFQRGYLRILSSFNKDIFDKLSREKLPGHRSLGINLERSESYVRQQKAKAQAALENMEAVELRSSDLEGTEHLDQIVEPTNEADLID